MCTSRGAERRTCYPAALRLHPPPPSDVSHFIHSEFKPFLDLAPQVRQLIKSFQESRYAESLALLDNLKVGQGQRLCNF